MDLAALYQRLYWHLGPQGWWPVQKRGRDHRFEIMVGAILTQNTAWTNVEKALANLRLSAAMNPKQIIKMPSKRLAALIRPAGYFNQKAKKLKIFSHWLVKSGGLRSLKSLPTSQLRTKLLSLWGIGPETADSILLYAFERPVFVVDAYTRRLCSAAGIDAGDYGSCQRYFESRLPRSRKLFNEYHALIVAWGKLYGNKKTRGEALNLVRA